MKNKFRLLISLFSLFLFISCDTNSNSSSSNIEGKPQETPTSIKIEKNQQKAEALKITKEDKKRALASFTTDEVGEEEFGKLNTQRLKLESEINKSKSQQLLNEIKINLFNQDVENAKQKETKRKAAEVERLKEEEAKAREEVAEAERLKEEEAQKEAAEAERVKKEEEEKAREEAAEVERLKEEEAKAKRLKEAQQKAQVNQLEALKTELTESLDKVVNLINAKINGLSTPKQRETTFNGIQTINQYIKEINSKETLEELKTYLSNIALVKQFKGMKIIYNSLKNNKEEINPEFIGALKEIYNQHNPDDLIEATPIKLS